MDVKIQIIYAIVATKVRDGKIVDSFELFVRQLKMYWATVRYAKSQLYDYYGTGARVCPAMYTVFSDIKKWSPEK